MELDSYSPRFLVLRPSVELFHDILNNYLSGRRNYTGPGTLVSPWNKLFPLAQRNCHARLVKEQWLYYNGTISLRRMEKRISFSPMNLFFQCLAGKSFMCFQFMEMSIPFLFIRIRLFWVYKCTFFGSIHYQWIWLFVALQKASYCMLF